MFTCYSIIHIPLQFQDDLRRSRFCAWHDSAFRCESGIGKNYLWPFGTNAQLHVMIEIDFSKWQNWMIFNYERFLRQPQEISVSKMMLHCLITNYSVSIAEKWHWFPGSNSALWLAFHLHWGWDSGKVICTLMIDIRWWYLHMMTEFISNDNTMIICYTLWCIANSSRLNITILWY